MKDWHKIFRAIAKKTPKSFMFVLKLGTTDIAFWNREYQICERGNIPTNYSTKTGVQNEQK